jgi:thiol-disulfide isomerase/thioredoxin
MLSGSLTDKLEIYRAMKVGNTAPDIIFTKNTRHPQGLEAGRMSELKADFIVVVFAAGWCPHCRQMMPQLTASAPLWREQGVEVVMVSLDSSADEFAQFTSDAPFIATTDLKRWESPIARSYHVHAVPAMILLDQHLEILIHLNSVQHADAWIDWNLTQGNLR